MLFFCVLAVFSSVNGCFINKDDYKTTTIEERLAKIDIIVFGKDIQHVVQPGGFGLTDSIFQIYCILKGSKTIPENITIAEISPRTECSGTYMYMMRKTNSKMEPGLEMIVGLQQNSEGKYVWHELNQMESSAFDATDDIWEKVRSIVPSTKWAPPVNSTSNGCPTKYMPAPANPVVNKTPKVGEQQSGGDRNAASSNILSLFYLFALTVLSVKLM